MKLRPATNLDNLGDQFLAAMIARMGLAREDDLHRAPRVHQEAAKPVEIAEDQVGPLVGGKPARKADRQRLRVEQGAGSDDLRGLLVLTGEAMAGILPDEVHEGALQIQMHPPEVLTSERQHLIPHPGLVLPIDPIGTQVPIQEIHDRRGHPGPQMDAVGDVANGNRFPRAVGPEVAPQMARELTVLA